MGKEPIQVWPSWGNDKWSDPDAGSERIAPGPSDATTCSRVWDYFAAHYRREYGREPDPDNKQTVLMCAWYVTGASDLAARRKFFPENTPAHPPPPVDPRFARFGEAMWEHITKRGGDFCNDEISEDILPLAEAAGLCCRAAYDPKIHGDMIDAEPGCEIWWWGNF